MLTGRWLGLWMLIATSGGWTSLCAAPAESPKVTLAGCVPTAIGVTRRGTEIPAWVPRDAHRLEPDNPRVLVIGGNDGSEASTKFVEALLAMFKASEPRKPEWGVFEPAFIPKVYPDGPPQGIASGDLPRGFPPPKEFYDDAARPEARYLWRWVPVYGAHCVIDVRAGKEFGYWFSHRELKESLGHDRLLPDPPADDFICQVSTKAEDLPATPGILLQIPVEWKQADLDHAVSLMFYCGAAPAESRLELVRRQDRRTEQVLFDLTQAYGHDLKQVAYIPALAVIGRLRTAVHTKNATDFVSLTAMLSPLLSGSINPLPKSGSEQAGHLLFAELAKRSEGKDRERWIELCRAAADQIFDKDGKPKDLMPFHNEMSDAVFMATPILCATGKLTGEKKYFDAAVTHFRSMKTLCLREDGIYRHSPLDEAAWGRGNGFPALGLAWALSEFPEDHAHFPELKKDFQNHITALLKHQDAFGCWHQVIDKPGSYREFSATCMIAWAMKRGLDRGWLTKEQCQTPLDRAWIAAKHRIGPGGKVVDICTGTGKQKSLRDYYDRPAIWGVDARGGAMALMLATEMMDSKIEP